MRPQVGLLNRGKLWRPIANLKLRRLREKLNICVVESWTRGEVKLRTECGGKSRSEHPTSDPLESLIHEPPSDGQNPLTHPRYYSPLGIENPQPNPRLVLLEGISSRHDLRIGEMHECGDEGENLR